MDAMPSYRPVNLPKHFEKFPMPVAPAHASAEAEEDSVGVGKAKAVPTIHGVTLSIRHCEERSDEAFHLLPPRRYGLLSLRSQ